MKIPRLWSIDESIHLREQWISLVLPRTSSLLLLFLPEKLGHHLQPLGVRDGVHVLDEVVAESPVTVTETTAHQAYIDVHPVHLVLGRRPQLPPEDHLSRCTEPKQPKVMEDIEDCDDSEDHEPEPEEDVDLLVKDVDGKDTLSVVPLDVAAGAVLVEGALGHPGEDPGHRVRPT